MCSLYSPSGSTLRENHPVECPFDASSHLLSLVHDSPTASGLCSAGWEDPCQPGVPLAGGVVCTPALAFFCHRRLVEEELACTGYVQNVPLLSHSPHSPH